MADPPTTAAFHPTDQIYHNRPSKREDFYVAIICALALEYDAVCLLVDHFWCGGGMMDGHRTEIFGRASGDNNTYRTGRMGSHDVVLTLLPGMGKASAAASTAHLKASFPNLRIALLVGVCGGVPIINIPSEATMEATIPGMLFLGDVVMGKTIVQYDFGRQYPAGFAHKHDPDAAAGAIRPLSKDLQNLLRCNLESEHGKSQLRRKAAEHLRSLQQMAVNRGHQRSYLSPGPEEDKLFPADYRHKHHAMNNTYCDACTANSEVICEQAIKTSCAELGCDKEKLIQRQSSQYGNSGLKRKRTQVQNTEQQLFPQIFAGCIASGDTVMKSGEIRDQLARKHGAIAFEMEGAGVWDNIPCLIVKGVCDYADSHKNKAWQPYAAATAAAMSKALLEEWPVADRPTIPLEDQELEKDVGIVLEQLSQTINRADVETLLSQIPSLHVEQRPFKLASKCSEIDPMFDWIFHNMDYKAWAHSTAPGIFWISGPSERVQSSSLASSYMASISTAVFNPPDFLEYIICRPENDGREIILSILKLITSRIGPQQGAPAIKMLLQHLIEDAKQHILHKGWGSRFLGNISDGQQISNLLLRSPLELLTELFKDALSHGQLQSTVSIFIDSHGNATSGVKQSSSITLGSLAQWFATSGLNTRIVVTSSVIADLEHFLKGVPSITYDVERIECLRSLDFINTRYDKISTQSRGSCEWIWTHPKYKAWRTSDRSKVLYVQGKPGSGKSTLTKFFSDNLASQKCAVVAKYFYSYREGEVQRSHDNMLRKVLHDILDQDESFFYFHFQHEYRKLYRRRGVAEWDYTVLKQILSSLAAHPRNKLIFMIIDAVDESDDEDRRTVIRLLFELCGNSRQCVFKIFVASRPVKQLEVRSEESFYLIKMQDQTKGDVERFACSLLQGLQESNIAEAATRYIVENAHGVFLWVSLVGSELLTWVEDGLSEKDIYERLIQLPTELQEMYEHMFKRLKSTNSDSRSRMDRKRMFHMVLFSKRPLSVQELLHAVGILDNIDGNRFIAPKEVFLKTIATHHRILSCAGNFLEIKVEKGKAIVQIIHQTVREFLLDPNGLFNSEFSESAENHFGILNKLDSSVCIATACIRYLMLVLCSTSHQGLPTPLETTNWNQEDYRRFSQYLDAFPFAIYAFEQLPSHLEDIKRGHCDLATRSIENLISEFIGGIGHQALRFLLKAWLKYRNHPLNIRESAYAVGSQQVCLGRQWLFIGCDWLLDEAEHTEEECHFQSHNDPSLPSDEHKFRDRLFLEAAQAGLGTTLAVVLRIWPDTIIDKKLQFAVLEAATRGHVSTFIALGEHRPGIYFSMRDEEGCTTLHLAAREGKVEVARAILSAISNIKDGRLLINATDTQGHTALRYAVVNNQGDMVRYLVEADADLDWDTGSARRTSVLHVAVMEANLETVGILLQIPRVDVNNWDGWGCTPLHQAVKGRKPLMVPVLLNNPETRVNHPEFQIDLIEGTPLQMAYEAGDMEMVLTLIKHPRVEVGDYMRWFQPRRRIMPESQCSYVKHNCLDPQVWQDGAEGTSPEETYRRAKAEAMVTYLNRMLGRG